MRYTDFLMLLVDKSIPIVSEWNKVRNRNSWFDHQKLAALTEHINYKCDFKDGKCKRYVHREKNAEMCCCKHCAEKIGHHHTLLKNNIREIARAYNVKTGFWRKGKGCILPRHLRSITCLTYNCSNGELLPEETALLAMIDEQNAPFRYAELIMREITKGVIQ